MVAIFATQAHGVEKVTIFLLFLLFFACLIGLLVFEVKMILHAVRNRTLNSAQKTAWLVGMLLIHPFVACAYYAFVYKDNPKKP